MTNHDDYCQNTSSDTILILWRKLAMKKAQVFIPELLLNLIILKADIYPP
ncbi:hypothetical protein [Dolichospermum sp. UHCC 0259]|nr:hypothetical protein [Dolichospermum sp. UHCC 0259]